MSTTVEESQQQQQQQEEHRHDVQQQDTQHKKLEGEELLDAIRKQVEYYLSRQNLNNDPFLVSHMDKDLFVSVDIIANFKMMKTLTEDTSLIMQALRSSTSVILDEQEGKLKPNFSISRNTVILRDIPSSTSEDEVKKIFADDNQPVSVRSDIGDTWFVTFDTDDQALQSLEYIRNKTFNDKAIKARIKSENLLKSFTQYSDNGSYQLNAYPRHHNNNNRNASHGGYNPHYENRGFRGGRGGSGGAPRRGASGARRGGRGERDYYNPKPSNKGPNVKHPSNIASNTTSGKTNAPSAQQTNTGTNYQQPQQQQQQQQQPQQQTTPVKQQRARSDSKGGPQQPRSDKKQGSKKSQRQQPQPAPVIDNTKNFPPLPSIPQNDRSKSGYGSDEFIKYSKQVVVDIYANLVKDLKKPTDLPSDCIAVVDTPYQEMELMKPLTGVAVEPVQQPTNQVESVDVETMISFAEAAITARDIKTPEITTEHLIPRRRSGSNAGPKTPQSGRKRSDSNVSNRSDRSDRSERSDRGDRSRSSSSASNQPPVAHIHRPEPIKPKFDKKQKPKTDKKEPKTEKKEKVEKQAPKNNSPSADKQSQSTSYASVLQTQE